MPTKPRKRQPRAPASQRSPSQGGQRPQRAGDVLRPQSGSESIEEWLNTDLVIEDYEWAEGEHGPYMVIQCQVEGGETKRIRTGSRSVTRDISYLKEQEALPITARFVVEGRGYKVE